MTAGIRKLVSGAQTGVDRAALDVAIAHGLPYGGWVPRGGRAEDFPNPPGVLAHYHHLREHPERGYSPRTEANVRDSGATLILRDLDQPISPGTKLTVSLAERYGRPLLVVGFDEPDLVDLVRDLLAPIEVPSALNVAGPRESSSPGAYTRAVAALERLAPLFVMSAV